MPVLRPTGQLSCPCRSPQSARFSAFSGSLASGYPLIFVAPVSLLYAIRGASPLRVYLLGLLLGTAVSVGGYYWIVHALTHFGTFRSHPSSSCSLSASTRSR